MVMWNSVSNQVKTVQSAFGGGENNGLPPFDIADDETMYSRNMDSWKYPAAAVRPGRSTYATAFTSGVSGIGQRNNQYLHAVDGNTWKYWDPATTAFVPLTTTLTAASTAEIAEFVTGTARYTILMNSTQKLIWDGTSTALVLGVVQNKKVGFFDQFKVFNKLKANV